MSLLCKSKQFHNQAASATLSIFCKLRACALQVSEAMCDTRTCSHFSLTSHGCVIKSGDSLREYPHAKK